METKKISVIVPIYNAEKYIEETIKSLLEQTLKEIEIILVNDGSKDSSLDICEKMKKKDSRIKIINKQNGGLADSRNAGMNISSGKYTMFLDADDLFEKDTCEWMYNKIEKHGADYVIGNYQMMDNDGKRWKKPAWNAGEDEDLRLEKNDYEKSFFVMNSTAWNKIYRTEFLRKNDITFKVPSPSEDDYFTSLCYIKAEKGCYTSKVMYLYRNSPNSLSKDCSLKYFKGINYAYKMIYQTFKENNEINYYRYIYAKKNAYLLCQLIDSEQVSDEEKIQCVKDFEWYFSLNKELKVEIMNEQLRGVMHCIRAKEYDEMINEINQLKEYRKTIPDNIKKRMSFPTREEYAKLGEYDKEFLKTKEICNV